jgi:hypothetical protein
MQANRSDCPSPADETQRIVLMVLLAGEHEPWSRAELQRELSGSTGDPVDPSDAINALYASGLVHVSGDLVFPSRAACLMDELGL